MKHCTKCGQEKPLDEYYRHGPGFTSHCKGCIRAKQRMVVDRRRSNPAPRPTEGEKRCPKCGTTKSVTEFSAHRTASDGLSSRCKACHSAYQREWQIATRADRTNYKRRRLFGVSQEIIDLLGDRCAICAGDGTDLDHDHLTGKIRGMLCNPCNRGLAAFRDEASRLLAAALYLNSAAEKAEVNQ